MGIVKKINFPYLLDLDRGNTPKNERLVIFFGTDFYNLPADSNREAYIKYTNKSLDYIRSNFAGFKLLYLPHPVEKDELTHLNLSGFELPKEHVLGEYFMYDNAHKIEYVFSTCSWVCGSAYAMGINAAVFLELLKGAVSEETIIGYRSYFNGLPKSFFINSFDEKPQKREKFQVEKEMENINCIKETFKKSKDIWILAIDPSLVLRSALLIKILKKDSPDINAKLIILEHPRWELIRSYKNLLNIFDETIILPNKRILYSVRPKQILKTIKVIKYLKKLKIKEDDTFISLSNLLFEENCILSYFKGIKKILLTESRWYNFIYEDGYKELPKSGFKTTIGIIFFNYILEPLLHLNRTLFKEYRDGKVINFFRYRKPLENIYDTTFVLMPSQITPKSLDTSETGDPF